MPSTSSTSNEVQQDTQNAVSSWPLIAAAGSMAVLRLISTSTILKLAAFAAGGAVAYQFLKPKSSKTEEENSAGDVLNLEEARDATERLASTWGAHLKDKSKAASDQEANA